MTQTYVSRHGTVPKVCFSYSNGPKQILKKFKFEMFSLITCCYNDHPIFNNVYVIISYSKKPMNLQSSSCDVLTVSCTCTACRILTKLRGFKNILKRDLGEKD